MRLADSTSCACDEADELCKHGTELGSTRPTLLVLAQHAGLDSTERAPSEKRSSENRPVSSGCWPFKRTQEQRSLKCARA
jgi:hypothetical protein